MANTSTNVEVSTAGKPTQIIHDGSTAVRGDLSAGISDPSTSVLGAPSSSDTDREGSSGTSTSASSLSPFDSASNSGLDASSAGLLGHAVEELFPLREQRESVMRAMVAQPLLTSLVAGKLADNVIGMARPRNGRAHALRNVGSVVETRKLQVAYPDFDLTNSFNINKLGHAFARDARELDQRFIYEVLIKYSNNTVLGKSPFGKPYDVLVKDVGGYAPYHFTKDHCKVHVCNPVLDIQDQVRVSKTMLCYCGGLSSRVASNSKGLRKAVDVVRTHLTSICRHRAQHCTVRAPFVTFVHSSYNITVDEIVAIMDRAEATVGFGCFIFDPCVLFLDNGVIDDLNCRFRKYKDKTGTLYIEFSFVGDVQLSYIHKFDTYVALVHANVLVSRNSDNYYAVTCEYLTNHTLFFRLTRCMGQKLDSQVLTKYVPIALDDTYEYIHSWKFSTIPLEGTVERVTPIRFRVPRVLLFKLTSAAMTVSATKFTLEHLRSIAAALNTKEIISGTSVNVNNPVDPETLEYLVVAVYFHAVISKWESGRLLQTLTQEEQDLRKFYDGGFLQKLWSKFLGRTNSAAAFSDTAEHPFGDSDTISTGDSFEFQSVVNKSGCKYWVTRLLSKLLANVRYHPIVKVGGLVRLRLDAVLEEHVQCVNDYSLPFMHLPTLEECMFNHEAAAGFLRENVPTIKANVRRQPTNFGRYCDCIESLQLADVPGDGDCFYHAVILCLDLNLTVGELRSRLCSSQFVTTFSESDSLVRRINSDGFNGWADDDVVDLCAHELNCTICVHMRDTPKVRRFNDHSDAVIHLDYHENHFSALLEILDVDVRPMVLEKLPNVGAGEADEILIADYNSLIEPMLRSDIDKLLVRADYSEASRRYHPLCFTGNFGYQSSYALLLNDLVAKDLLMLNAGSRVLDVNTNNGSSTQFYVDTIGCDVLAMCSRPVPVNVRGRFASNMYSATSTQDFERYIHRADDFDCISLNPPHYVDKLMTLDLDNFNSFLKIHFSCINKLKVGGILVLCAPVFANSRCFQLLTAMGNNFDKYVVVRSGAVPPHNPWCMIVFSGRKQIISADPPCPLVDTTVQRIIRSISHMVLDTVYLDNHLVNIFHSLSQLLMQNLINATDRIRQEVVNPNKNVGLPLKQYDLMKTALRVDVVRKELAGGANERLRPVAFTVEIQPSTFVGFNRDYVKQYYPSYLGTCTGKHFDSVVVNYSKAFTAFHLNQLENVLKRPIVFIYVDETLLNEIRHLRMPDGWKRFYETFVVAAFYSSVSLNLDYAKLQLKREDLLRGCVVDTSHFVKPKNMREIKELFKSTTVGYERMGNTLKADVNLVNTIADKISRYSVANVAKPLTKVTSTLSVEPTLEQPATVNGGSAEKRNVNRLGLLRRDAPAIIDEYRTYCNEAVKIVNNNCKRIYETIKAGCTDTVLTRQLAAFEDIAYMRRRQMVCGSRLSMLSSRYVYAWNDSGEGDLLFKDNENFLNNYDHIVCYRDMKILIESDMLSSFRLVSGKLPTSDIGLMQAAAGCGKTHSIITTAVKNRDHKIMILTSTKEGELDVRSRLANACNLSVDHELMVNSVRTIDSYVVHKRGRVELLLIDEALMQHPGKLLMAIEISGANKVRLYGDILQIPFINLLRHLRLKFMSAVDLFPVVGVLYESRRVPDDICRLLNDLYLKSNMNLGYNVGMKSLSSVGKTTPSFVVTNIVGVADLPVPSEEMKVLCFTQSDKEDLNRHGYKANTIHEYQGKEADVVCLVRLDAKDANPIYHSMTHAVTALTRHKRFLTYFTASTGNDAVKTLLGKRMIGGGFLGTVCVPNDMTIVKTEMAVAPIEDLVSLNNLTLCEFRSVYDTAFEEPVEPVQINSYAVADPVQHIQMLINSLLPGTAVNCNEHLQWIFHHSDFKIEVGDLRYNNVIKNYRTPKYDKMRPVICSGIHATVLQTPRNTLNAIAKRNVNVPKLTMFVDQNVEVLNMVNRLRDMCPNLATAPISISFNEISKWFNDQDISCSDLVFDDSLLNYAMDHYELILKANAKPELTVQSVDVYPQPQTILFQKKYVNAVFCTMWREIRDRVCSSLSPNLLIYTGMSPDTLSNIMTRRLSPARAKYVNAIEFDMKKYDKSQGALILEFELQVLKLFGVDQHLITLWFNAHVNCDVTERSTKLSFRTWYQRKSGDASTFFGNTLALMVMLTDIIDLRDIVFGVFAGDDSVIYTHMSQNSIDTDVLAYKYNLECKMYVYRYQYFCSKFIIAFGDRWLILPDPLKRAVKLGRRDLANTVHVEEYRKSLLDDTRLMGDMGVAVLLSEAVSERYMSDFNSTFAILAINSVARDKDIFHELYYSEPGDLLCHDPTLQVLEL